MKKKLIFILMILSAMLIFSACSTNSANESEQNSSTPIEDQQENESNTDTDDATGVEGDDNASPNESEGSMLAGELVTVAQLEGGLQIGDSKEDVSILFDSHPYHEVTSLYDGGEAWRYDIGAPAEYSYDTNSDVHDHDGVLSGDVPLQIYIYFDSEDKVSGYSAYQEGAEGTINVYQTLSDGTRKVDIIE